MTENVMEDLIGEFMANVTDGLIGEFMASFTPITGCRVAPATKNPSPDPPFISHYAIIQGEMGLFLTFSVFELQRGYLYQNGVEFRQKVIGAG